MKITMGDRAKDIVTGFTGIITGEAQYIAGCNQVLLSPQMIDGKFEGAQWFDLERIEIVERDAVTVKATPTGGPGNAYEQAPVR